MIYRTTLASAVAVIALGLSAVSASATSSQQSSNQSTASSGGHSVCLKHQCPGRPRLVCGCASNQR